MNEDYPRSSKCPDCGERPCECDNEPVREVAKHKREQVPKCFRVCDSCGKKIADCKCEEGHELSKLILKVMTGMIQPGTRG